MSPKATNASLFDTGSTSSRGLCNVEKCVLIIPRRVADLIFGKNFWQELTQVSAKQGGRAVIHAHPEAYQEVPVTDANVCRDIDTPADLSDLNDVN